MRVLAIKILTLATVALGGCGATHHFVPNQPLPKGEWRFSAVIHYDLHGMTVPNLIPDFNVYGGLGMDYSLGVGVQFPFLLTHLSSVKYFDAQSEDAWAAYLHVNNLFAVNLSPQIEMGGTYFATGRDLWQSVSLGVGYGYRPRGQRFISPFKLGRYLFGESPRLIPSFKYAVSGEHLGISYVHHFGLTNLALRSLRAQNWIDTAPSFVIFRDSIELGFSEFMAIGRDADSVGFLMQNGDTLVIKRPTLPFLCGGVGIPDPGTPETMWLAGHKLSRPYWINRNRDYGVAIQVDVKRMKRDLKLSGRAVLIPYEAAVARALATTTTWKSDHSLGIVYTDRIRN